MRCGGVGGKLRMKSGVTVHTYNPSTWEMEVGGSVQGQSQLSENPAQKKKTSRMCIGCFL